MSLDFGMAVTLVFWAITLTLAASGRGRGRFARLNAAGADTAPQCAVYPLVLRHPVAAEPCEELPQAS